MSGHSKWHTIKHKKAAADSKRGKAFTRIIKEITVAARIGGGDAEGNPRLRTAVGAAKAVNMPADNIKRAIQKGTGELPGISYEEILYEGYGPGGAALLVEAVTDNKMRTLPEIRHLFGKHGGNLGENGSVAWMFQKKGLVQVDRASAKEDAILEAALEAGALDVVEEQDSFDVYCPQEAFEDVKQALEKKGFTILSSQLGQFPQNYVELDGKKAAQMMRLMEAIEEHDDVQNVWSNFDFDESSLSEGE